MAGFNVNYLSKQVFQMNQSYSPIRYIRQILAVACVAMASLCAPPGVYAFNLSAYAQESVLANGRWVKISVPVSGLYMIPLADLRSWGFSDVSKVRVHGYGARRIPDLLTLDNYVDDLPQVQSELTSQGLVFYAVGPEIWVQGERGRYTMQHNIYSVDAYYFLTDSDTEAPGIPVRGSGRRTDGAAMVFNECVHHEQNLYSASENGWLMLGEDFRVNPSRTFTFDMPGRVEDEPVWLQSSFVAKTSGTSRLTFTANNMPLPTIDDDNFLIVVSDIDGVEHVARRTFDMKGTKLSLGLKFSGVGTVSSAGLNYLTINYTRRLELGAEPLEFDIENNTSVALKVVREGADVRVWDVTDPSSISRMECTPLSAGETAWVNDYTGKHKYVAWYPGQAFSRPSYEGAVSCQNLHGLETPDMVIVTPSQWRMQAERIADLHRAAPDNMDVVVVTDTEVYNEFASGAADVSALRKFFKMFYDRGAEGRTSKFKYALLMGAPTYDNRHLTEQMRSQRGYPTLPSWYGGNASAQMNESSAFGTDDFVAILGNNSGFNTANSSLSIAVGRMPVKTLAEARNAVDKLEEYMRRPRMTSWKTNIMLVADNGNAADHMKQSDAMALNISCVDKQPYLLDKVYIDAYPREGGIYQGARDDMFRLLNEGVAWWMYLGHANTTSWTSDGLLTYNDINNRMYYNSYPMLFAATCEFLRWDSHNISGGELLYHERNGGIIGAISAVRPVYIGDNGKLAASLSRFISQRDEDGRLLAVGEMYRQAKNASPEENNRRYVFMGDPALRIATPYNVAVLKSVNSVEVKGLSIEDLPVVGALDQPVFAGVVTDPSGNVLEDFNGLITVSIYDAEYSVTSNGDPNSPESPAGDGVKHTFEKHGSRIYAGSTSVKDGHWEIKASIPLEIADNFRPASLSMYAYSTADGDGREAAGISSDFYVYGYAESPESDTTAPVIETMVLNHSSFKDGDRVNTNPVLLACVRDDIGLNLSSSGIGHQMSLVIDEKTSISGLSQYFVPSTDGSASGTITYPLEELAEGKHTLRLRVWDTSGNSVSRTINFEVGRNVAPVIHDVYTDVNPASVSANFYVSHNRPEVMADVTVTVYNLMGQAIWSGKVSGRSDSFISTPVTWDLTDYSGRRVARGIYLYRAAITTDGETYDTAAKRIAVTGN